MPSRGFQLALVATALGLASSCTPAPAPVPAPRTPAPRPPPERAAPPPCQLIVRIEVRKEDRILRAFCARGAVVEMTAALGRRSVGHKTRLGDLRTPEGLYRVAAPARDSDFHRFIPLDYPSLTDADAALAARELSPADHARIAAAHAAGEMPPADTSLGGAIGIHGEGRRWQGYTGRIDWTDGCVAVTDAEIDFLGAHVETGTPVEILP